MAQVRTSARALIENAFPNANREPIIFSGMDKIAAELIRVLDEDPLL